MSGSERDSDQKGELFARLLGRCQRKVFLYALGLIHNAADAEEVLQETNIVLWRKFDEYEPGTSFESWACRVAYFEVLKYREKTARERRVFSLELVETLAAEAEKVADEFDDRRDALQGCLTKLRDVDRKLVLNRYRPGATTRGLAEAAGRSVQGTRKSLHRVRMTLLECIQRTLTAEARR
ncbi:MAG: sigma-70 family RNA polymerase sigma factor [Planctomycetaceae bacterium]|nr:sigma-70 family RNA polymerase sigma factor [Planctomycetaceae bacterium]